MRVALPAIPRPPARNTMGAPHIQPPATFHRRLPLPRAATGYKGGAKVGGLASPARWEPSGGNGL